MYAIEIEGLGKTYAANKSHKKSHTALKQVSLQIPVGSVYGLLGPNGAGKSTLINILAGIVLKSEGKVKVMGYDLDTQESKCKLSLGVVLQELHIDPFFTPRQILDLHAGLFGVRKKDRRTDHILSLLHLTDKANSGSQDLSGGMRRRLMVAKAMVHNPPILILDEPTAGVDVDLRHQLWEAIRTLNAQGTTILLTTHYLEEAEAICEHIAILNHGNIITDQPTKQLIKQFDSKILKVHLSDQQNDIPNALTSYHVELTKKEEGGTILSIHYKPSEVSADKLLQQIVASKLSVVDIQTQEASLEDIFLQLTR
ncbi:MAG: ABC transporter ATP-binding protein [Methylacidiphilales bacterium]|nr:ABC transporter ATP-binding protein [Candidatus Methylacidiphilales bacterium]